MKSLWNSFKIAFAMFSKIPMPQAEWTEEKVVYTGRIVLPDPDIYIGWKREKNAQPL